MSNKFDSTNYPPQVPTELQLGDFWAWKREDLANDYPVADYSLSYEFNLVDGATASNFTFCTSILYSITVSCMLVVKLQSNCALILLPYCLRKPILIP